MTTIEPTPGYKLTQVAEVPLQERVTASKITTTAEINPDDWKEITEEEAAGIRAEQKAARDAAKVAVKESGAKITQQEPKHTGSGDSDSEKGS